MARKREDDEYADAYFHYTDAAEQATLSTEGAFEISNAPELGRKGRGGRSFESPTRPAAVRPAVAAVSQAAPPVARQAPAPTPAGSPPVARRAPTGIVGVASGPTGENARSPVISGGVAAGGGAPPKQVQAVVPKPLAPKAGKIPGQTGGPARRR